MDINVAWQKKKHKMMNDRSRRSKPAFIIITGPQVALDDHLILLLVPPGDDEVVLRRDEPQELLKPTQKTD